MTLIRICVDPGASISKILYCINNQNNQLLLMDSTLRKMNIDSISHSVNMSNNPAQNAWVRIRESDLPVAVGFLAKNNYGRVRLDLPKYSLAIYKILAAIGAIAVSNNLKKIRVVLGVLLPYGELGNREDLFEKLKTAIKTGFYFQEKKILVKLEDVECVPEGYGLIKLASHLNAQQWSRGQDLSVLMYGERNTSCLTFSDGALVKKHSSTVDIGFHRVKENLGSMRPGLKPEIIDRVLPRLAFSSFSRTSNIEIFSKDCQEICWLASTAGYSTESEREKIVEAIEKVKLDVWLLLTEWLDVVFPPSTTGIVISGGASHLWKPYLMKKFQWVTMPRITWLRQWIPHLMKIINLHYQGEEIEQELMAYRNLDIYGYWCDFQDSFPVGFEQ